MKKQKLSYKNTPKKELEKIIDMALIDYDKNIKKTLAKAGFIYYEGIPYKLIN